MELLSTILSVIGILTISVGIIRLISYILHYTSTKFSYAKFKGDWAVVTGASGGIGEGMVYALASRGVNVILIARSVQKMEKIASECAQKYNIDTKVISFDFANASDSDYAILISDLQSLSPTILVNNVGINVEMPTELIDMNVQEISNMVTVNIMATNKLTMALLPEMLNSKSRGIILCLSSAGGVVTPAPLLAPYAGTKAYNDSFAVALNGEVKKRGIHVHSLTPFFVESSMAKMRKSFTVPSAKQFAHLALDLVGSSTPRLQPYWVHYVMQLILTALPLSMQVQYVTDLHRKIRKKALRKKEKLAKLAAEQKTTSGVKAN